MYHPQSPELKEASPHGTQSFPCAFYQTQMSGHGFMVKHHWHKEAEILYFPGGNFRMEINMEAFDIRSECFYFINPGELHSVRAASTEVVQEYAVVFHPELLCSPFYDTVQSQLIQPLQNGQLHFPRSIEKEHPAFPRLRTIFLNIAEAFPLLFARNSDNGNGAFSPHIPACLRNGVGGACRPADDQGFPSAIFRSYVQIPAFFPDRKNG